MLSKIAFAAVYAANASAFQQQEMTPEELSIMDEIGSTPCIFKLDNAFYDFTPLKVFAPATPMPYYDG